MRTITYKVFSFQVTDAEKTVSKTFELDKNVVGINGIQVGSLNPDMLYLRGSQKIEISKVEILPENYLTQWIMTGLSTPMNDRIKKLKDVIPGNRTVRVDYKDNENGVTAFKPYSYYLSLECEIDDAL